MEVIIKTITVSQMDTKELNLQKQWLNKKKNKLIRYNDFDMREYSNNQKFTIPSLSGITL